MGVGRSSGLPKELLELINFKAFSVSSIVVGTESTILFSWSIIGAGVTFIV